MQVLGIVGPNEEAGPLATEVGSALADRGEVAVVERAGVEADEGHAVERHRIGDGGWSATGGTRDLDAVLADLAPRADYAVVRGFPEAAVPTVALARADHRGETLAAAPDAKGIDVDAIVADLEDAEPYETLESLVAAVTASPEAEFAGAVATFTGRVREREDADDAATEYLEFEKYEGVAEARMETLRDELEARDGVHAVRLHHKTGVVEAGEDIVFVVVLAGHRTAAFETVSDGIDRLKDEVPLFKKEVTVEDEFWAHQHETGETRTE